MDAKIKTLLEERLKVWERMKEMLATAEKREDGQAGLSGDKLAEYRRAESDLDSLGNEIEARRKAVEIEAVMNQPLDEVAKREAEKAAATATADPRAAYENTFRDFMRATKDSPITGEQRAILAGGAAEQRDQGVATGGAGGYFVPQGFLVKITEVLKYFGPMRDVANIITTASGNALPWPHNDDTGNVGSILAENTAVSELDVTLTTSTLNAYVYTSGLVKVSWQLQNDSAFDIEAFLSGRFGERLGRIQNTHFTTGSGTGQPQGFVTGASKINALTTGHTTTAPTYASLVTTQHTIDPAYRTSPDVCWQMHDTILAGIRQLVDSNGRPLWVPAGSFGSLDDGQQDTLLGRPVRINNDMASVPAASAYTVAFGDFKRGYIVRDVVGIGLVKLEERFADQLQTGFFAWMRSDARVDDPNAVAFLQNSAT